MCLKRSFERMKQDYALLHPTQQSLLLQPPSTYLCSSAKRRVPVQPDGFYTRREHQAPGPYTMHRTHKNNIHAAQQSTAGLINKSLNESLQQAGCLIFFVPTKVQVKLQGLPWTSLGKHIYPPKPPILASTPHPHLARASLKYPPNHTFKGPEKKCDLAKSTAAVELTKGFQLLLKAMGLEACALSISCLNERCIPAQHHFVNCSD